jgi:D-methionine transport system substrate-binding protein
MKMKKKLISVLLISALAVGILTGCGNSKSSDKTSGKTVTLTCLADTTPHAEILKHAEPQLKKEGIKLDIKSETWDKTWNEQVENGDVDFHYDAYIPYLDEWNKANKGHLVSAGKVHYEPLVMMSDKYKKLSQLPDNAKIAIKEDVTNQYRCLKLLEQAGLIECSKKMTMSNADTSMITKYKKPIKVVAMDADVIMRDRQDFDAYITNTNRLLDAKIDPTKYLVRENEKNASVFGNVICVNKKNVNNKNIKKLVKVLQSKEMREWIKKHYKGAILPCSK